MKEKILNELEKFVKENSEKRGEKIEKIELINTEAENNVTRNIYKVETTLGEYFYSCLATEYGADEPLIAIAEFSVSAITTNVKRD